MGPRLCRRGNKAGVTIAIARRTASMGPRLCRRGNLSGISIVTCNAVLQWGHVFVDVEIAIHGHFSGGQGRLQWGHVFVDVEIHLQSLV